MEDTIALEKRKTNRVVEKGGLFLFRRITVNFTSTNMVGASEKTKFCGILSLLRLTDKIILRVNAQKLAGNTVDVSDIENASKRCFRVACDQNTFSMNFFKQVIISLQKGKIEQVLMNNNALLKTIGKPYDSFSLPRSSWQLPTVKTSLSVTKRLHTT